MIKSKAILKSIESSLKGECPLCNGFKKTNNISNQDFILVVIHFSNLLKKYNESQQETNETIISAIEDFDYIIRFLTDRWTYKENSDLPRKFMIHNPTCSIWRKNTSPDMFESGFISTCINSAINS
jgi:hypothetical protein